MVCDLVLDHLSNGLNVVEPGILLRFGLEGGSANEVTLVGHVEAIALAKSRVLCDDCRMQPEAFGVQAAGPGSAEPLLPTIP